MQRKRKKKKGFFVVFLLKLVSPTREAEKNPFIFPKKIGGINFSGFLYYNTMRREGVRRIYKLGIIDIYVRSQE